MTDLLDEALLLTTELSTNGVMHAGTDLDLEILADSDGVTVTVLDQAPGRIEQRASAPIEDVGLAERGRGLLLVDHFASRWGTIHYPKGKGVWFRLERSGAEASIDSTPPHYRPIGMVDELEGFGAGTIAAILDISPDPVGEDATDRFAEAVVRCLAERVGVRDAAVRLDRADGDGLAPIARYGESPGLSAAVFPLPVSRPWSGVLEMDLPPGAPIRSFALLAAERIGLVVENERLRMTDRRRQTWLTFLAETSELLAQSLDVELTLALVPRLVVPRLGLWCAVHVPDEFGDLAVAAVTHADETATADLVASFDDDMADRLAEALAGSASMPLGQPVEGFVVPLIARGLKLGTIAVGRHLDHRQEPEELAVLEDIARRVALALDNAHIHAERRRIAHALQLSLLPPALPVITGVGLGAEYVPTGDEVEVGGDFYDVVSMPDGRWLVVVGDVSGKGVQAASVTGHVRDVIRVLVADGRSLPAVLTTLNSTLAERGHGRFCTLAMAAVGRGMDGMLDVSLHLAGHDKPVLLAADGRASFVGSGGTALGLLDTVTSPAASVALRPGDALVFYTDGVTERRRNGELFGTERLRRAAAPLAGYPADVIAARLRATTLAFSTETPRDDIAILTLRNTPPPRLTG